MLLRDSILAALKFYVIATPILIGDTIGEDKFKVLKMLRRLAFENRVVCHTGDESWLSDRYEADCSLYSRAPRFCVSFSGIVEFNGPSSLIGVNS
jgi:hypothetical protein